MLRQAPEQENAGAAASGAPALRDGVDDPTTLEEVEGFLRQRVANRYLGRGYDTLRGEVREGVFERPVAKDVFVAQTGSFSDYASARDRSECLSSFESQLAASLKLPYAGGIAPEARRHVQEVEFVVEEQCYYRVSRYIVYRAHLLKLPPIRQQADGEGGGSPAAKEDDGYVHSCGLVLGYHIVVHTSMRQQGQQERNQLTLGAFFAAVMGGPQYERVRGRHALDTQYVSRVEIKGIGGYHPRVAVVEADEFSAECLVGLDEELLAAQHRVDWHHVIDPVRDVRRYHIRRPMTPPLIAAAELPEMARTALSDLTPMNAETLTAFTAEVEQILQVGYPQGFRVYDPIAQEMRPLDVRRMGAQFQEAFLGKPTPQPGSPCPVLVIGATGVGKSTFVAHLMRAQFKPKYRLGRLHAVLIREDSPSELPEMGSSVCNAITTKLTLHDAIFGAGRPFSLCDCPGIFDPEGLEVDICNNMCLQMLAHEAGGVAALVVVIDARALARDNPVLQKVSIALARALKNPREAVATGSVVFAISGLPPVEDPEDVVANRAEVRGALMELRQKYSPRALGQPLAWTAQVIRRTAAASGLYVDTTETIRAGILETLDAMMYRFDEDVLLLDVFDRTDAARNVVSSRLCQAEPLSADRLNFSTAHGAAATDTFRAYVMAVVQHGSQLHADVAMLRQRVRGCEEDIRRRTVVFAEGGSLREEDQHAIEEREAELSQIEGQLSVLSVEIAAAQADEAPRLHSEWKTLKEARGFWKWWWYSGEEYEVDLGCDYTFTANPKKGEFKKVASGSHVFKAVFIASWWGYSESNPGIEVFVSANRHPTTLLEIRRKEQEQETLMARRKVLKRERGTLWRRVRDTLNERERGHKQALRELEMQRTSYGTELARAEKNYAEYNPAYQITLRIIEDGRLVPLQSVEERALAARFRESFVPPAAGSADLLATEGNVPAAGAASELPNKRRKGKEREVKEGEAPGGVGGAAASGAMFFLSIQEPDRQEEQQQDEGDDFGERPAVA